jgi:hypothetical protein
MNCPAKNRIVLRFRLRRSITISARPGEESGGESVGPYILPGLLTKSQNCVWNISHARLDDWL